MGVCQSKEGLKRKYKRRADKQIQHIHHLQMNNASQKQLDQARQKLKRILMDAFKAAARYRRRHRRKTRF